MRLLQFNADYDRQNRELDKLNEESQVGFVQH
jgi:hypothetical protein